MKYTNRIIKKKLKKIVQLVSNNREQIEKDCAFYEACHEHPFLDMLIERFNKIDSAITKLYFGEYLTNLDNTYADLLTLFDNMSDQDFDFCAFNLYNTLNGRDVRFEPID